MTLPEFLAWREFFRLYPFDDLHRYHRPAALVAGLLTGGNDPLNMRVTSHLDWLQDEPPPIGYSEVDMSIFRAFGVRPPKRKK